MGLGGIIMGALGGAGEQAASIGSTLMKSELDKEKASFESDLILQRTKALKDFENTLAVNTADRQRTDQAARINNQAGTIADQQGAAKLSIINAGIAEPSTWTPEQQAAVNQSQALDRSAAIVNPKVRMQAAEMTGDIDPKTAATLDHKSDALMYKSLYENMKEQGKDDREDRKQDRLDTRESLKEEGRNNRSDDRLDTMLERFAKMGQANPTKEALSFLNESRKEIAGKSAEVRALMKEELADPRMRPEGRKAIEAKYKPKFDELDAQRKAIEQDYGTLRKRIGLDDDGSAPPVKPSDKPAGMVSNGAPYAEGTKLTGPGGAPYIVKNGRPVPMP